MYEVFLRELLEPLGIYDLSEESVSGAEIFALGAGLDTESQQQRQTLFHVGSSFLIRWKIYLDFTE